MSKVRLHTRGEGWNFIIWEEENVLRWQLCAGFITEGTCTPETSERETVELVLEAHFEPRYFRSLTEEPEKYEPFYDDPRQFPEAFEAKRRLEEMIVQPLFE